MKKFLYLFMVVSLIGCATYTPGIKTPKSYTIFAYLVPGSTQVMNGEYLKGALFFTGFLI